MERRLWRAKRLLVLAAVGLAAVTLAATTGCETPPAPYVPKPLRAPEVLYCNDTTGHKPGTKPWVMGGKCCCTPSEALMALLHRDGFCQGMTADQLRNLYESKGVALRGPGHESCNGLCKQGPHVVLGGKCMCPPVPGTDYYERVVTGRRPTPETAK